MLLGVKLRSDDDQNRRSYAYVTHTQFHNQRVAVFFFGKRVENSYFIDGFPITTLLRIFELELLDFD